MDILLKIGSLAGIAAFMGLALLILLYFSQARDVRRLRERAAFVPEGFEPVDELGEDETAVAEAVDDDEEEFDDDEEEAGEEKPKAKKATPSARSQRTAIAAARQAELARAAAERRARFEQRRGGSGGGQLGSRYGRMSDRRGLIFVLVGVAVLIVGVVLVLGKVGGGGDSGKSSSQSRCGGPAPQTIEVAVLNGTSTPGAAATIGDKVTKDGFKLGNVTNSETPFEATTVMYSGKHKADASRVACDLELKKITTMTPEIKGLAEGAPTAVVVGTDKAGGSTGAVSPSSSGLGGPVKRFVAPIVFAAMLVAIFAAMGLGERSRRHGLIVDRINFVCTRSDGEVLRPPRKRFTPNRDGRCDVATIRFRITRSDDVDLAVVNADGETVRTLFEDRPLQAQIRNRFFWNGREDNGLLAPAGPYTLRITLVGKDRTVTPTDAIELVRAPSGSS